MLLTVVPEKSEMKELNFTLISAGVDYLTVTQKDRNLWDNMRAKAFAIAEVELSAGMFGSPKSLSGYEGFSVGGLLYGERHDSSLVQLSSVVAQSHWRSFYEAASNVTRIDVQATFRYECDPAIVVRQHLKQLQRHDRKFKAKPKTHYKVDRDGGMTVYSGSRTSHHFLRIYDKQRESKLAQFKGCVRYELEVKGKKAVALSRRLFLTRPEHAACGRAAVEFSRGRGACVKRLLESFAGFASKLDAQYEAARISDVDRTSQWLRVAVRPTVQSIASRLGPDAVLALLGLDQHGEVVKVQP